MSWEGGGALKYALQTVKQNFVAFFVFGVTAASFGTKICSPGTGMKREAVFVRRCNTFFFKIGLKTNLE
jgi:hypothetical protein